MHSTTAPGNKLFGIHGIKYCVYVHEPLHCSTPDNIKPIQASKLHRSRAFLFLFYIHFCRILANTTFTIYVSTFFHQHTLQSVEAHRFWILPMSWRIYATIDKDANINEILSTRSNLYTFLLRKLSFVKKKLP